MTETMPRSVPQAIDLHKMRICILVERDLRVFNISQSGLAVHTEKPLHMGQVYSLQLRFNQMSISLDGEVARCSLDELYDTLEGEHSPLYINGIAFKIERNPLELSLLDILQANVAGEKRKGGKRIRPQHDMWVDIGRLCFPQIKAFNKRGILLTSTELIDLDADWNLLIQADGRAATVCARVLHASKKSGEDLYTIRVEFHQLNEEQAAFVENLSDRINN